MYRMPVMPRLYAAWALAFCVVHKDRLVIRKVAGLHQRGEDLRLWLEQMDITGGNAAVKQ